MYFAQSAGQNLLVLGKPNQHHDIFTRFSISTSMILVKVGDKNSDSLRVHGGKMMVASGCPLNLYLIPLLLY